ncbi:MAG: hypothetical protein RLZZ505_229 [Verrucomicrobiota bacterium]|jgi:hypothetical protein
MPRHPLKSILCAVAALLAWAILPGTFLDRGLLYLTARAFVQPPFFISGKGSHDSPAILHALNQQATAVTAPFPDVAITDDPDRVFQNSPPSPVDFAIILKNLRRLGRDSVGIGMPLSWPAPDVISLMALDQQLDALPSVVTSAPLARGAVPAHLPPAFRRASVELSKIHGNPRDLPLVNRVSIPDVLLGNTNSLAGFTTLESEPDGGFPHLLARWDDRVVFSFPLLAALADRKVSPAEIEIHLGKYILLGKDNQNIPIDGFGRLAFKPPSSDGSASIPAETLIDAPDNLLSARRAGMVLIRNGMSAADEASLAFSQSLVPTVSLLAASSGTASSKTFERMPQLVEWLVIASLISFLHGLGSFPKTSDRRALAVLAGILVILHFILVPATGTWPPTLSALAAVLAAIPLTPRRSFVATAPEPAKSQPKPVIQPEFQLEIETITKAAPEAKKAIKTEAKPKTEDKKAAKKVPKTSVKKAPKKPPAKKSPRKRKGK